MMAVAQVKRTRYDYIQFSRWLISSLVKTGFPESKIVVICNSKEMAKKIGVGYSEIISCVVPFATGKMGWFFKPVAYSTAVPDILSPNATMVMCDADMLFYKNPQSFFSKQKSNVWTLRREKYLRPSRKAVLAPRYISPRLDNFKDLAGYMGRTRAYVFLKYKMTKLPEMGLYSDLVSIKPDAYSKTIKLWREIYDDVIKTKHIQGDQQMLDAAVRILNLTIEHGGVDFVGEFNCGKQKQMYSKSKEMRLQD